jgi:nickel-type superoxide dismutase maturation protease
MVPTLLPGDIVLVDTWIDQQENITIGDIIVFKREKNGIALVKRINKIRHSGSALEYFVLGDNPAQSIDSRRFGWISAQYVIGKVNFVLFSAQQTNRFLQQQGVKEY